MAEALLVGRQVLLIFLYVLIGIFCVKKKIITSESGKEFSKFIVTVIMVCLIIKSYIRPMETEHLLGIVLAIALAALFHIIAIIASTFLIKEREDVRYRIERMGIVYSNCGFMGIPLIYAAVGDIGIFYAVAYISIFNIVLWSHGVMMLSGEKKFNIKSVLINPALIAFTIGFIIYTTQIPIPNMIVDTLGSIADMNTPLAMITTGVFLANIDLKSTFANKRIYYVTALRLIILPMIMLTLIKVLGVSSWMSGASNVVMANVIGCACPAAASITLFPVKYGMDGEYGAQIIAVSTLLSIISIPVFTFITNIWL
ncbi:AEC family transporter [Defluviitalea saccharophila]|jgi:predicted permease|uniref:AEC family transporter n=1 Tax=Defluviitalea saccharophila TaxID=879970 RepID=A0ABZ2Y178_9FIRM|nr:AEC family transporter [Candidatus Epulonipiscium sp.]